MALRLTEIPRKGQTSELNSSTPVNVLTADAMDGVKEMCLLAGMSVYITKPSIPDSLLDILKKWL